MTAIVSTAAKPKACSSADTATLIHALQSGDTSPETIALVVQRLRELQDKQDAVMVGLAGLLVEVAR